MSSVNKFEILKFAGPNNFNLRQTVSFNTRSILAVFLMLVLSISSAIAQTLSTSTVPNAVNDTISICVNSSTSIAYTASYSSGHDSIVWTFQGGSIARATGAGSHPVTYSSVGVFRARVRVYDTTYVLKTKTYWVDARTLTKPTLTVPDTLCESDGPITLIGSPAGGTYSGVGVSGNKFDPDIGAVGNRIVTYTVTNGACSRSVSDTIYVKDAPEPNLKSTGSSRIWQGVTTYYNCDTSSTNSTFVFYNQSLATNYSSYTLDFGDGSSVTGTTFPSNPTTPITHTYVTSGLYEVKLTLHHSNGCDRTSTINIFFGRQPAIGFNIPGGAINQCIPDKNGFIEICVAITNVSANSPFTIYTLSSNDGSPDTVFTHPPPDTVCHRFYIGSCGINSSKFTDAFELSLRASVPCIDRAATVEPIYISKPSVAAFLAPQKTCVNNPVTIVDNSVIGGVARPSGCLGASAGRTIWEISPSTFTTPNGLADLGTTYGLADPQSWVAGVSPLNVTFTKTGTYTVTQIVGNALECSPDTITSIICVDSLPVVNLALSTDTVCINQQMSGSFVGEILGICDTMDIRWHLPNPINGQLTSALPYDTVQNFSFSKVGTYPIRMVAENTCDSIELFDTVVVQGIPTVLFPNDTAICGLASVNFLDSNIAPIISDSLSTVSYSWSVIPSTGWSFIGGTSQSSAFPLIDFTQYGTFQVVLTVSATCGSSSDTMTVTLTENPTLNALLAPLVDTILCEGNSIYYKVNASGGSGPYQFEWGSFSLSNQSSSDSIALTNLSTDTTLYVKVTDALGCSDSVACEVNVMLSPVVAAGADQSVCPQDSVQLNGTVVGGTAPFTYQWTPNAGLSATNVLNPWRIPLDSTVMYTLRVTDSLGCIYEDSVLITVHPKINFSAGTDFSLCLNQGDTVLSGASHPGGTWIGIGVSGSTFSPLIASLGNHTLLYSYTGVNGCPYIDTLNISVIAQPNANFGMDVLQGCTPLTVSFTDSSGAGSGHQWFMNGQPFSTAQNPIHTFSNTSFSSDSVIQIKLLFQAGSGCTDSIVKSITVWPAPKAQFSMVASTCAGDSISVLNNSTYKGSAASYRWAASSPSISISDTTAISPIFGFPTFQSGFDSIYSITLIVISNDGCSDTISQNILIHSKPLADFTLPAPACAPYNLLPTNVSIGTGLSYQWSVSPMTNVVLTGGNTMTPNLIFTSPSVDSTTYTIVLSILDTNGCVDSISKPYTVYAQPTAGFTKSKTDSCGPFTVNFTNTSTVGLSGLGQTLSYQWTVGAQTFTSTNLGYSFTNSGVHDSTYMVQLIATNSLGCSDTLVDSITVHPNPKAQMLIVDSVSCAPFLVDSTQVKAVLYNVSNQAYEWRVFNMSGVLLQTNTGHDGMNYSITNGGDSVLVQLIATSPFGCASDTSEKLFYSIVNPIPDFSVLQDTLCSGASFTFFDSSSAGVSHQWFVNDSLFSTSLNPSIQLFNSSNNNDSLVTIKLRITAGSNGCSDSISKMVVVQPAPLAQFALATSLCANDSLQPSNTSVYGGTPLYSWSASSPLVQIGDTSAFEPYISFPDNQSGFDSTYTIQLIVVNNAGCADTSIQSIVIRSRPVAQISMDSLGCGPISLLPTTSTTGQGFLHNWSVNPTVGVTSQNTNSTSPQFSYVSPATDSIIYTIQLAVTDGNGCQDSTSKNFVVYAKPSAGFVPSNVDSCGPLQIAFTNTSNPNITSQNRADMTFDWSFGNGLTSTDSIPVITFTNTGIQDSVYSVQLIATNSFGCADTVVDSITVRPNPRAEMLLGDTVNCAPFSIDSTSAMAVQYPLANSSYTWRVLDMQGNLLQTYSGYNGINYPMNSSGDSVMVQLIANSSFGCKADTMQQLYYTIVNPQPNFAAVPDSICSGGTVAFMDSSTAGVSHEWFINDSLFSTIANPSLVLINNSFTTDSTIVIKLRIKAGSTGCADSISKNVVIHPAPDAQFSVLTNLCANDSLQPTSTSQISGTARYQWSVSSSAVQISDSSAFQPMFYFPDNQSGVDSTYTIQLRVTNSFGCFDTTSHSVIIYSRPMALFSLPANGCGPFMLSLHDSSIGTGLSYNWSINPVSGVSTSGMNSANPQFNFQSPAIDSANYDITLSITDANGCIDTLSQRFTVYPKPLAGFLPSNVDSCGPLNVVFANTSSPNISGQNRSAMTFDWSFGNGLSSTDSIPAIVFTNTGVHDSVYTVQLIATNSFGCSDTLIDSIRVRPNPLAEMDTNTTRGCTPFVINDSVLKAVQYIHANSTYQWYVLHPTTRNVIQTFTGYNAVNYQMLNSGDTVLIRLVVSSLFGCKSDTLDQLFRTIPNPEPGFVVSAPAACHPFNLTITDTSSPGLSYAWYINGVLQTTTLPNPSFTLTNTSLTVDSTYVIKLLTTAGTGCVDSISDTVTVYALPNPSFTANEVCGGDTTSFSNTTFTHDTIVGWFWDFGDSDSSALENPRHAYTSFGTYTVSLTATDSRGCSQTYFDTIIVRPNPVADFSASQSCGQDTACLNRAFSFTDMSSVAGLGGNITIWKWDILNDGTVDYTSQNPQHTFTQSGVFDVKLIVETQYGCVDSIVRQVLVLDPISALFTTDTSATCGPLTITAFDSSAGPITEYFWELVSLDSHGNPTSIYTSTQASPNPIPTLQPGFRNDTTYILKLRVLNCCDTVSYQKSFRLKPLPVAGIVGLPTSGCSGFKVDFTIDGHTHGQPDSVMLKYGDGTPEIKLIPNVVYYLGDTLYLFGAQSHHYFNTGFKDTTYFVTIRAVNDCGDSTFQIPILVHPNIVQASFTYNPQQGCEDLKVDFTDASFGGNRIAWYFDYDSITNTGQFTDSGSVVSHTYTNPGTYLVAQIVDDGCSYDTAYIQITVFDAPDPEFSFSTNTCEDDSTYFTNLTQISAGNISLYRWYFGDGNTSTQKDPVHIYDTAGVYTVWLIASSTNGCSDSISHQLTIFDKPRVEFGYQHACLNQQPIFFTDSSSLTYGTITGTVWDFGDGNSSTLLNPQHTYSAPGTYLVTLRKTSSNGCEDTISHNVQIFPIPTAGYSLQRTSGDSCGTPQTIQFTNNSTGANGYLWDFNFNNAPGTDTSSLTNPVFTYNAPGVYQVLLIARNGFSCWDSAIHTIMVRPFPKAGFMGDTIEGCIPFTVTFTDTSVYDFNGPGGIVEWYWDFGDGNKASGQPIVQHRYEIDGVYTVKLRVVTDGNCSDSVTYAQYISAHFTPEAAFSIAKENSRTYVFGNSTFFKDPNTQYYWTFGDGEFSREKSPRHIYNVNLLELKGDSIRYTVCLTATNSFGCDSTVCHNIDITGYLLNVPNAFAPDQQGVGDGNVFLPKGHSLKEYHLKVYDKWGNVAFETYSVDEFGRPNEPWDGTYMGTGDPMPMGAYVWKIVARFNDGTDWPGVEYDNGKQMQHGTITLIR